MIRKSFVLALAGALIAAIPAHAQCRGGGQGAGSGAGLMTSGQTGLPAGGWGMSILGGQSSSQAAAAQQMRLAQIVSQQMAMRQAMLAYQERQQQARQEQLSQRRDRAEQKRAQVAESRARTRAALAAQNGLTLPRLRDLSRSVAWQADRR
jgi:hypothetical protein